MPRTRQTPNEGTRKTQETEAGKHSILWSVPRTKRQLIMHAGVNKVRMGRVASRRAAAIMECLIRKILVDSVHLAGEKWTATEGNKSHRKHFTIKPRHVFHRIQSDDLLKKVLSEVDIPLSNVDLTSGREEREKRKQLKKDSEEHTQLLREKRDALRAKVHERFDPKPAVVVVPNKKSSSSKKSKSKKTK
jgi:hypothetical protein